MVSFSEIADGLFIERDVHDYKSNLRERNHPLDESGKQPIEILKSAFVQGSQPRCGLFTFYPAANDVQIVCKSLQSLEHGRGFERASGW